MRNFNGRSKDGSWVMSRQTSYIHTPHVEVLNDNARIYLIYPIILTNDN